MFKEENRPDIPNDEFKIVSMELKYNVIGIKAGSMFTITYSVLWNVSRALENPSHNLSSS